MNRARKLAKSIGIDRFTWEITDHPPGAVSCKYQPGTRAWKKIYNEIWDTSQLSNAIPSKRYRAKIRTDRKKICAVAMSQINLTVRVKNVGGAFWWKNTYSGRRIVRLGAQLYDAGKNLIDRDFARSFLTDSMSSGCEDRISMSIICPEKAGDYKLKLDMVAEGIDWFEDAGSPVLWLDFAVGQSENSRN